MVCYCTLTFFILSDFCFLVLLVGGAGGGNFSLHWSLIVICHPGLIATFKDENVDDSVKVPCVLHMDSIRGSHAGLKDLVQSYLLEEWKEKQKDTSEDIVSKFINLRFLSLELPQQENCSDCGLFLLHYAELFIAEAPENFSPFQINKFENFLKPDWFMPAEASLKRVHIQRLIYELLEGRPLENASPCSYESQSPTFPNKDIDNSIEIISKRSPRKSWNPLHSEPVQGMELGLMDMSLYRTHDCTGVSGLGMKELLEQYDQGDSFVGQPGHPMPRIKEEVGAVDLLASSSLGQTELQTVDGVAAEARDIGYTPTELNGGFPWNSGLSIQDPEENILPASNCSDDDSEGIIIECGQEVEGATSGQNTIPDQLKENVDSLTESYASASSDMMETPAEDSQELAKIYGSNNLEGSLICNQEEANKTPHQDIEEVDDDGNTAGIDEVVEDSSTDNDEERAAKRIRLTASGDGERELVTNLSQEVQV
ncbi:putative ubiquitin-like-specific protease 2B [Bienertia sinuspersici]